MSTKMLVCIIGGSGSGKSTLEDEIIIHDGFSKTVSTTTRDKRDGEHNGREYHFVDTQTFTKMDDNNELVESFNFTDNFYGLTKNEFNKSNDHLVFVVEPNGYVAVSKYIKENKIEITPIVIYMDIPEKERFKNMIKRGDDPIGVQERLKAESIVTDFKKLDIKHDIRVSKLHPSTVEVVMEDIYIALDVIKSEK
jgi:guanylate kinase